MSSEQVSITPAELEELGSKLDAANLSEKDKRVLLAAFTVAGQAVASAEVTGFSVAAPSTLSNTALASPLKTGLVSGFQGSLAQGKPGTVDQNAVIISIGF